MLATGVVDRRPPLPNPEQAIRSGLLRFAIANSRLVGLSDTEVAFRWKDYRHHGKSKVMTLAPGEFIRRFLLHTLPDGFHRIRHHGFLANTHRHNKLALCRKLLDTPAAPTLLVADQADTTVPHHYCPCCGGPMIVLATLPRPEPCRPSAGHDSS